MNKKKLLSLVSQMKKHEKKIGEERDKIRKLYEEIEDFYGSISEGHDDLHAAILDIECAIETLSEKV